MREIDVCIDTFRSGYADDRKFTSGILCRAPSFSSVGDGSDQSPPGCTSWKKSSVGTMLVLKEYKRLACAIRENRCQVKPYEEETELLDKYFGSKGILEGIRKENDPVLYWM